MEHMFNFLKKKKKKALAKNDRKKSCQTSHFLLYNQMVMNHVKIPSTSMNKYFMLFTNEEYVSDSING